MKRVELTYDYRNRDVFDFLGEFAKKFDLVGLNRRDYRFIYRDILSSLSTNLERVEKEKWILNSTIETVEAFMNKFKDCTNLGETTFVDYLNYKVIRMKKDREYFHERSLEYREEIQKILEDYHRPEYNVMGKSIDLLNVDLKEEKSGIIITDPESHMNIEENRNLTHSGGTVNMFVVLDEVNYVWGSSECFCDYIENNMSKLTYC